MIEIKINTTVKCKLKIDFTCGVHVTITNEMYTNRFTKTNYYSLIVLAQQETSVEIETLHHYNIHVNIFLDEIRASPC